MKDLREDLNKLRQENEKALKSKEQQLRLKYEVSEKCNISPDRIMVVDYRNGTYSVVIDFSDLAKEDINFDDVLRVYPPSQTKLYSLRFAGRKSIPTQSSIWLEYQNYQIDGHDTENVTIKYYTDLNFTVSFIVSKDFYSDYLEEYTWEKRGSFGRIVASANHIKLCTKYKRQVWGGGSGSQAICFTGTTSLDLEEWIKFVFKG